LATRRAVRPSRVAVFKLFIYTRDQ